MKTEIKKTWVSSGGARGLCRHFESQVTLQRVIKTLLKKGNHYTLYQISENNYVRMSRTLMSRQEDLMRTPKSFNTNNSPTW